MDSSYKTFNTTLTSFNPIRICKPHIGGPFPHSAHSFILLCNCFSNCKSLLKDFRIPYCPKIGCSKGCLFLNNRRFPLRREEQIVVSVMYPLVFYFQINSSDGEQTICSGLSPKCLDFHRSEDPQVLGNLEVFKSDANATLFKPVGRILLTGRKGVWWQSSRKHCLTQPQATWLWLPLSSAPQDP